jgi:hypothetical protein
MKKLIPVLLFTVFTAIVFSSCGTDYDLSTPESTIKTLIEASSKKDKEGLSKCFSKQSAGEFKTIVNQTLSEQDLTELQEMFGNAKVLSVIEDDSKAVVSVELNNRKEEISMAKQNENWVILDF